MDDEQVTMLRRLLDKWDERCGQERRLKVRWLMNPDAEPIPGAEIVEQSGIIMDVRPLAEWQSDDVWPVLLTPPLINSHTHLEFSSLEQPLLPSQPFPDWIRSLMRWRREQPMTAESAIQSGMLESQSAGVAILGEITTADPADLGIVYSAEHCSPLVVSFRECIGLREGRVQEQVEIAKRHLDATSCRQVIRGLSPHAPYTVHPMLLADLAGLAAKHQVPIAMHLAETRDELELLERGTGRLSEFLQSLDLFDLSTFPGSRSVLECLEQIQSAPRALVVHGNYLRDSDVAWLKERPHLSVVYCPRTHAYFGHERYPLEKFRDAGLRVVLGTDSRASNPDLSIWRDLQFVARQFPEISISDLIAMVTRDAAEAIGFESCDFSICPADKTRTNSRTQLPSLASVSLPATGRPLGTLMTCVDTTSARDALLTSNAVALLKA